MPTSRQRAVAQAVEASNPGADLLIIDGRTGRAAAHRPGTGTKPEAALVVVGPIDLGNGRYAVRPNRRHGTIGGADDLAILTSADRRRVRRERNRRIHAARARAHPSPGGTSAPEGAPDGRGRPGARAGRDEAPTRPEVRAI